MSQQIEDINTLLLSWGLNQETIELFEQQKSSIKMMAIMTVKDVDELFENFYKSEKFIFKAAWKKWRQENENPVAESDGTMSMNSEVARWIEQQSTNSPSSSSSANDFTKIEFKNIDIDKILQKTIKGQLVNEFYAKNQYLNSEQQRSLVKCIIDFYMGNRIHLKPSNFKTIADAIVTAFKSEDAKDYYNSREKGKHKPSGKLYDRYSNECYKTKYLKLTTPDNSDSGIQNNINLNISKDAEVNLDTTQYKDFMDDKTWLANNLEPWDMVCTKWSNTAKLRLQLFKTSSDKAINKFLEEWPLYKNYLGYQLIDIDFDCLMVNKNDLLLQKFDNFVSLSISFYDYEIKDKQNKQLLEEFKKENHLLSQIKNCDIVLDSSTSKNGSFQSPMYPGTYPQKTFCRYDFRGKGRERIQIIFTDFSVPSEGDPELCDVADTLKIFLYVRSEKKLENVETLCGDTMPKPIMSNGPRMVLEFRGDKSGKGNRGFRADYIFLENFGVTTGKQIPDEYCSFHFNSSNAVSGWFHSPNFPGFYPRNIECSYFFHGGNLDKVLIRFSYFDVEGIPPCDEYTASDSVELSNFLTTDRKFMRHCGQTRDFTVRSDGKFFRITFRSNDRLDGTGFRAFYAFETEKATTETIPVIESSSMAKRYKFSKLELSSIVTIAVLINYIKSCYINL